MAHAVVRSFDGELAFGDRQPELLVAIGGAARTFVRVWHANYLHAVLSLALPPPPQAAPSQEHWNRLHPDIFFYLKAGSEGDVKMGLGYRDPKTRTCEFVSNLSTVPSIERAVRSRPFTRAMIVHGANEYPADQLQLKMPPSSYGLIARRSKDKLQLAFTMAQCAKAIRTREKELGRTFRLVMWLRPDVYVGCCMPHHSQLPRGADAWTIDLDKAVLARGPRSGAALHAFWDVLRSNANVGGLPAEADNEAFIAFSLAGCNISLSYSQRSRFPWPCTSLPASTSGGANATHAHANLARNLSRLEVTHVLVRHHDGGCLLPPPPPHAPVREDRSDISARHLHKQFEGDGEVSPDLARRPELLVYDVATLNTAAGEAIAR